MQSQPQSQIQVRIPFAWKLGAFLLMPPFGIVGFLLAFLGVYIVTLPWALTGHTLAMWTALRFVVGIWLLLLPAYQWILAPRFGVAWRLHWYPVAQSVLGTLLLGWPVVVAIAHGIAWLWHTFWLLPGWMLTTGFWIAIIAAVAYVVIGIARTPKHFRVQARRQRLRSQTGDAHDDAPVTAEGGAKPDLDDSEAWGIGQG